jgi:ATP-dependent DNA helicase RecG
MRADDGIEAPPALKEKLRKLGLIRRDDLLLHLPARYENETVLTEIAFAPLGAPAQVEVSVLDVSVQFRPRRQLVVHTADSSGELVLRFLNFYVSQTRQFEQARDRKKKMRVFGEVRAGFFGPEMVHPRYRALTGEEALPCSLTPVYPTTAGISQAMLRGLIGNALREADLSDCVDFGGETSRLPTFSEALRFLHAPPPGGR